MSPTAQIEAFAQSIYLVIKNRYYDDLTTADGQVFLQQIIDFTNQFIDELENEVDGNGAPVDWVWVRQSGYLLGTAAYTAAAASTPNLLPTPTTINNLLTDENRYVQIVVNGQVVSTWSATGANDLVDRSGAYVPDMVAIVGSNLQFSRPFKPEEDGGAIIGDVTTPLPRILFTMNAGKLTVTNAKILTTVRPKALLMLGVAKNATLPDIVKGVLSPSYVQKYDDLLQNAITRNVASSVSDVARRDDFSNIRGVGF